MIDKVGVIGCGWLGLPLAKHLISIGYQVKGSTTTAEKLDTLKKHSIEPFQIQLEENKIIGDVNSFLSDLGILIINIPPKLRKSPYENYMQKIKNLIIEIKKSNVQKIIFVSSTSVYGKLEGIITEETEPQPNTESGKQLLASENMLSETPDFSTTVIRFGGLIDNHRHPVYFLSGRENLTNGNETVNLIHLNDCIGIIDKIIREDYWGKIVNGVFPYHPTKKEYYQKEAKKLGLSAPGYAMKNKKISKKIVKSKNFLYKYLVTITTV